MKHLFQSVVNIFKYSKKLLTNIYSDIRLNQFFFDEHIWTFIRIKFVCMNIYGHSFVSETNNKSYSWTSVLSIFQTWCFQTLPRIVSNWCRFFPFLEDSLNQLLLNPKLTLRSQYQPAENSSQFEINAQCEIGEGSNSKCSTFNFTSALFSLLHVISYIIVSLSSQISTSWLIWLVDISQRTIKTNKKSNKIKMNFTLFWSCNIFKRQFIF